MWVPSLGVLPLPNSLWTTYVYKGYFHTLSPRGTWGLRYTPTPKRFYGKTLKRSTPLSDQVSLLIPSSVFLPSLEVIQMEEELGYNPALQWLQDFNQARAQLECKLGEQAQKLAHKYDDPQIKVMRKHKQKWARMAQEGNATFQEVFPMTSLADSIKLIPWCISSTIPFSYMGNTLATTVWQGKNAPSTTAAHELEESTALRPTSSVAHLTKTLPVISLLSDLPFVATPPVGHPFAEFLAISTQKKWDCSPSSSLGNHCGKRTLVSPQEVEVSNDHSSRQGDESMPKLVLEAEPTSE